MRLGTAWRFGKHRKEGRSERIRVPTLRAACLMSMPRLTRIVKVCRTRSMSSAPHARRITHAS